MAEYKKMHSMAPYETIQQYDWRIEQYGEKEVKGNMPYTCRRITIFIQTFLSFVPGLSWVPLPKEVAESNEDSRDQILLNRKMFEFFGEDATQFLLQAKSLYISPVVRYL